MRLTSRVAGTVASVVCGLALSGCAGLDSHPASNEPDRVADGSGGDTGDLAVRQVLVQPQPGGAGVTVIGAIYNQGTAADTLTGATVASRPATVQGDAEISPGETLVLGPLAMSGGPAGQVKVTSAGTPVTPGSVVEVMMSFRSAPALSMTALVIAPASPSGSGASSTAATISPSPAPTG